ncbi:MAG: hypothetical protein V1644_00210 [Candidatus Micrarchaeota archaeon]
MVKKSTSSKSFFGKSSKSKRLMITLVLVLALAALIVSSNALGVIGKVLYFQSAPTCFDSDGGNNSAVYGGVNLTNSSGVYYYGSDLCQGSVLLEFTCPSNLAAIPYPPRPSYFYCPGGCEYGACVPITYTCRDTDSGIAPEIGGNVSITSSTGAQVNYSDSCNGALVVERYCSFPSASVASSRTMRCQTGQSCLNGRCAPITYTCTDSDGNSSTIRGNVAIVSSAGSRTVTQDGCTSSTAVMERICSSSTSSSASTVTVYCSSGKVCLNGACVIRIVMPR